MPQSSAGGWADTLSSVLAGLVAGLVVVISSISFAALIFSGPLAGHVPMGIGLALLCGLVLGVTSALSASHPVVVSGPQGAPASLLGLVTAAVAAGAAPSAATLVAAVGAGSVATGLALVAMGALGMGSLVRFIPYPVVGGFIAGTGWLLVRGAFAVMVGAPLSVSLLPELPALLLRWLPGLGFALALLVATRRVKHFLVLPGLLAGAIVIFYAALALSGHDAVAARAAGLLLPPLSGGLWPPPLRGQLASIDWHAIAAQAGSYATIALLSAVSILLNASGFELVARQPLDLNRELRSVGVGNLLAGLGGGIVGYHSLGLSALALAAGARTRAAGLASGGLCAWVLFVQPSLVALVPRPVLGGLLLFTGLAVLYEWVVEAAARLPRADYAVVLAILGAISLFGFLEGVAVGLVLAVILFLVAYSRVEVIKHALDGRSFRSKVDRSPGEEEALRERGGDLLVYELQGFLFFGTANHLYEAVRERCGAGTRFVVLDFRLVSGIDSSAVLAFRKLAQHVQGRAATLVVADPGSRFRGQLEAGGLRAAADLHYAEDLDRAVEACEDRLLSEAGPGERQGSLLQQLGQVLARPADGERMLAYFEAVQAPAGHHLIRQGEGARDLLFIEDGRVTARLELPGGETIRLRTCGAGTVVGEVALYLGEVRSASVVTDAPTRAYRITAEALRRMRERDPDLAAAFHELVARTLARRVKDSNATVQELLR